MIADLLPAAARRLQAVSDSPRLDAEVLLAHLLACDRSALIARSRDPVDPGQALEYETLLSRRGAGVPLAYLTGRRGFWSLDLEVTPDVLVPRPETELLVEWGLECLASLANPRVADLGTGSGCIALSLARERGDAAITAVDASTDALAVAQRNAQRLGLTQVRFECNSFTGFEGADFSLLVSNPPYVANDDPHLKDLAHEPRMALVAADNGLAALREICGRAHDLLAPGGWLLLEHGAEQGRAVRDLLESAGLDPVQTRCDLAGLERASGGQRPRRRGTAS